MKKRLTALFLMLSILLCGCAKDLPDATTDTDALDTSLTSSSSDEQTETAAPWKLARTKNWNFSLVPSENYGDLPEDYDLALSLDIETFSISEIPETIKLRIVNQTGKTFHICTAVHLETLTSMDWERGEEYFDIAYNLGLGWGKIPFTTYEHSAWATTKRSDVTYAISLEENLKENAELAPGLYRFVAYSPFGPHYAYFEITE